LNTVNVKPFCADDFKITLKGEKANVMYIMPNNVVTGCSVEKIKSRDGDVDIKGTDVLKLIVVERHHRTGNMGKGLLKGYGFKGGAMGITIAHDSHNAILLGDDNESMAKALAELERIGGGMVIADSKTGEVYSVQLDIGGLMSSKDAISLAIESKALIERAYDMGVDREKEAFMSLAFLSLAVIPEVKLVDKGLFDVRKFEFMELDAE
jgi:adenine deaminase